MLLSKFKRFFKSLGFQIPLIIGTHFVLVAVILSYALIQGYQISKTRTVQYGTLLSNILIYQEKINNDAAKRILEGWEEKVLLSNNKSENFCVLLAEDSVLTSELKAFEALTYTVVTPDLLINCTKSNPEAVGKDVSHREYLIKALKTKQLTKSGYLIGEVSGVATTVFALPILDTAGEVNEILVLSMGLSRMEDIISKLPIPYNSEVLRLDSDGILLAKFPSELKDLGKDGLSKEAFSYIKKTERGYFDAEGRDGIRRTYTFNPVYINTKSAPDTYIAVGLPRDILLQDVDQLRDKIVTLIGLTFMMEFIIVTLYSRFIYSKEQ